jgi:hypothetical protein
VGIAQAAAGHSGQIQIWMSVFWYLSSIVASRLTGSVTLTGAS